jgi:hypothetical protein
MEPLFTQSGWYPTRQARIFAVLALASPTEGDRSMRPLLRSLAAAALSAAWIPIFPTAHAQTESQPPGLSNPSSNIPDQKLDAAAAAMEKVAGVQQDYRERIAAADPSEKERLASEGTKALVKAVTDEGLSVEEYTSILRLAQNDPEVRQKLIRRLDPSTK